MRRVLVVDDSRVMQRLVASHLSGMSAELFFAKDGAEGALRFAELAPDLVVSDIEMPDKSGVELAAEIRAQAGDKAKIVLMSGGDLRAGAAAVERGDADVFLPKPLDRDALRRVLDELVPPASAGARARASAPNRVRVLIADDTELGRRMLERVLSVDPGIEIAGLARDGVAAVELAERLRPDLVLLDAVMPGKDGIAATREIMERAPSPVVLFTSGPDSPAAALALEATRAGAVDIVTTPGWGELHGAVAVAFRERLKALAEVPVIGQRGRQRRAPAAGLRRLERRLGLLAICGSTGGPAALVQLLAGLVEVREHVPVAIVQHILPGFAGTFAEWLSGSTGWPVCVAEEGSPLEPGCALLAPDGRHLVIRGRGVAGVEDSPPVGAHRPSGTPLFESAAQAYGPELVALLLTGMGEDGVRGLAAVRERGGAILVQAPASCVVPGMPEAAIREGLADHALSPDELRAMLIGNVRASV